MKIDFNNMRQQNAFVVQRVADFIADIHEIDFGEEIRKIGLLGKVDLVCGGPPCQGFSTVGKKDYRDPRNSLFWEFLRAVKEISPRFVLFETEPSSWHGTTVICP